MLKEVSFEPPQLNMQAWVYFNGNPAIRCHGITYISAAIAIKLPTW